MSTSFSRVAQGEDDIDALAGLPQSMAGKMRVNQGRKNLIA
jgi:hypothetical protein